MRYRRKARVRRSSGRRRRGRRSFAKRRSSRGMKLRIGYRM